MAGGTDFRRVAGVLVLAGALGCGGAALTTGNDGSVAGHAGGDSGLPGDASPNAGVVLVPIESRETIADPRQPIVYLSATSNSATNPKSVVAVSTTTGAVVWATPLPFEPGHIAVADDGSTLYATAWPPEAQVARLNLSTHAIELMFSLPKSSDGGGQYQPDDVTMIPGSPRTAIVSMRDDVVFGAALAVFDDASMRPSLQANLGQHRFIMHMGGGMLYALAVGGPFLSFTVDAQGLGPGMAGEPPGSLGSYARYFSYDGELIFSNDGIVIDPRTGTQIGVYDGDPAATAVDRPGGRTYLAMQPPAGESTAPITAIECDRLAFTRLRKVTLGYVGVTYRMIRAMDGTLALDALLDKNELLLIQPSAWTHATPP